MKKGKIVQYIVAVVVVLVLLCGIFTILRRLTGTSSTDTISGKENKKKAAEATTEKKVDNSRPMTSLTITAPQGYIRVGETMQLDIKYEPADASNTDFKWTTSGGDDEDLVEVSSDGVLTPAEDSEKNTVTVTAEATDGSGLSQSFELRILPEIDPSKPMVAITFDDGPYPDTTNVMLDALEENYAKATFFCLGQNVNYYPETVQREYDLGMEVGTHTYSHVQLTTLSASALDQEISKAVEANKSVLGVAPTLMRPPYGSADKTVLNAVGKYGLCCINWSLDTEDWKTKNADATYQMVMKATDGDVVLLHDIHEYNVAAVQRFVPDLMEEGFQLVTVSELYKYRGETLDPGTIHFRTDPTTESSGETAPAGDESQATTASDTEQEIDETDIEDE
ncbi:MAG: polysaccharide deacetylase family protein [Eubacterium sp.]|nr:polysaccharide deacetylase family protein [Eubacterium sp.]